MSRPARGGEGTRRGRCEMNDISGRETMTAVERGREFWRETLLADAFTAVPRWTREPVAGMGQHEARLPGELVGPLRRLAHRLAAPFSSGSLTVAADGLSV